MANHAYAKFTRQLNLQSVILFCNFISERDFGGVLVCTEDEDEFAFSSALPDEYWTYFADMFEMFIYGNNNTLELRHTVGADMAMEWARPWLHTALAGAFGASNYKDDGVGNMSFLMHTNQATHSYHGRTSEKTGGSFGNVLRLLHDAHKTWVKKHCTNEKILHSRLASPNAPRLGSIGDGFVSWALHSIDAALLPCEELVLLAISDSTAAIPQEWLSGLTSKQYEALYFHAVRHDNIAAQATLLPGVQHMPTGASMATRLHKLPEFKYADTPYDVWDRATWLKGIAPARHEDVDMAVYTATLKNKTAERIDRIVARVAQVQLGHNTTATTSPA